MAKEAVNKVKEILDKMNLKYRYVEEEDLFIVPFESDIKKFNVLVVVRGDWVTTLAMAARKEELPKDLDEKELYKLLLRLSLELSEVTFGLTELGDIVVHAESHVKALSPENFEVEFASVVFGVDYFAREIAPKLPRVKAPNNVSKKVYYYVA